MAALEQKIAAIDAAMADTNITDTSSEEDTAAADALERQADTLLKDKNELEASLLEFSAQVKSLAGVVICVDYDGKPNVYEGLLRPDDAKRLRVLRTSSTGTTNDAHEGVTAKTMATMPESLVRRFSAQTTAACQVALCGSPAIALAVTVHALALEVFRDDSGHHSRASQIRVGGLTDLAGCGDELRDAPALRDLEALRQSARAKLPENREEWFAVLLAMTSEELLSLLAVLTAATVNTVVRQEGDSRGVALRRALSLDMTQFWQADGATCFNHLTKPKVLEAIAEFAPSADQARLAKLKKREVVLEAERLVAGTHWLPPLLRAA